MKAGKPLSGRTEAKKIDRTPRDFSNVKLVKSGQRGTIADIKFNKKK